MNNGEKKCIEKTKEILNRHGCDPPSEDLFEMNKNIEALAELIKKFEQGRNNKIK